MLEIYNSRDCKRNWRRLNEQNQKYAKNSMKESCSRMIEIEDDWRGLRQSKNECEWLLQNKDQINNEYTKLKKYLILLNRIIT